MNAQHTPGPWTVDDIQEDRIRIVGPENNTVADCCDGFYNDEGNFVRAAESEANARLIAAAPDLLAALVNLLDEYNGAIDGDRTGEYGFDQFDEVVAARAAIAKATGEGE